MPEFVAPTANGAMVSADGKGTLSLAGLGHVLVLSAAASVGIALFVLVGLDGWTYYTAPAATRGYTPAHQLLRPAGHVGHLFGIAGFLMMLAPVAYAVRKKVRRFREMGSMKMWLDLHIFCGVVGPVFVTFHTSFKFNGIISAAYWSMVAVVLSGFIGRYLYTRIPRSLRGLELGQAELDRRAADLGRALASSAIPAPLLHAIETFEHRTVPAGAGVSYASLFLGDLQLRREVSKFRAVVAAIGHQPDVDEDIVGLATERATLLRRMAYLRRTKQLFDLWHVFHMPLVYIMFAIVAVHVAVTLYMGYVPFMD